MGWDVVEGRWRRRNGMLTGNWLGGEDRIGGIWRVTRCQIVCDSVLGGRVEGIEIEMVARGKIEGKSDRKFVGDSGSGVRADLASGGGGGGGGGERKEEEGRKCDLEREGKERGRSEMGMDSVEREFRRTGAMEDEVAQKGKIGREKLWSVWEQEEWEIGEGELEEEEGVCRATGRRGSWGTRGKSGGSLDKACWGRAGKFMEGMRSAEAGGGGGGWSEMEMEMEMMAARQSGG